MLTKEEYHLYRYEPSPEDIAAARERIEDHEAEIKALDADAAKLIQKVQLIQAQKQQHRDAISKCKGVMTLARRIPGELLASIFEICVADGWTQAPLSVSRVCSAWREAAQSPRVWSHVYIDCDHGIDKDEMAPCRRAKYWLRKAQQSPLHITFRTAMMHVAADTILGLLLKCASQWRSFKLMGPYTQPANLIIKRCSGSFLNLRELMIATCEEAATPHRPWNPDMMEEEDGQMLAFHDAFKMAPQLSNVTLTTDTLQYSAGIPSQVTRLSLQLNICHFVRTRPFRATHLVTLLNSCPNLKEFSLGIPQLDVRELFIHEEPTKVTMPNLLSLTLDLPSSFLVLVQLFIVPQLQRLYLRSPDDSTCFADSFTREAIRNLMHLSPPLRVLELYDLDISQDDFKLCFASLPLLEELRLHGSEIRDETIQTLCGLDGLCPILSKLDLRWCGHLTGSVLVDLVRSRTIEPNVDGSTSLASSSIREVTVINCSFVEEEHILNLATMTKCRLCLSGGDDFCKPRSCCDNGRYRQRFRLRHVQDLTTLQLTNIQFG